MVIEQDRNHVLCSCVEEEMKGALAQVLIGNSYSTAPEVEVRFAIIPQGPNIRMLAYQWVETQMTFGHVRRMDLIGKKNDGPMLDLLRHLDGKDTPPAAVPTVPAASATPSKR